ncbi:MULTISPECIES: hypothetical protein [unclassified Thermoanaerobacterium]|uniref:hypothetical protein n=1 Tax=unclassified Thermoanaerobacterium TaxID=2622527 RepID=UPI0005EE7DBE|nr:MULTISPECIES: hypothetical protein [unclassified Thermoanaerobacterium]MDE4542439.1 hypothetical protein [Thermoanaerobacterium sp. R66]ORX24433.1 hypothetical protein BVF91_00725 [Thermoanaerobacterium sp. PSU-2]
MFSISVKQRKIFYTMLSLVWIATAVYSMINDTFAHGLEILLFGAFFIAGIALIQAYMIRMLKLYDKNLKNEIKKKNKKRR